MSTLYNFCGDTKNGICVKFGSLLKSGLPCGSDGKDSACKARDLGSLGWEDPLEEGIATHSSILAWRIPLDRGARRATVHGVTKSWPRPSV